MVIITSFYGSGIDYSGWLYHVTAVMMFTNCCINPFIYAAKYREFQAGVRRLLSTLKLGSEVNVNSNLKASTQNLPSRTPQGQGPSQAQQH